MRFLTTDECRDRITGSGVRLDDKGRPPRPSQANHHIKVAIPSGYTRLNWFCRYVGQSLEPRKECLLWVTDWGIWDENLHLYYRLRQSYGDSRLLHEAPGHLFLDYEGSDLTTFLEVAILCGWDAHLLPTDGYARAFVSHDEFIEFASDEANPDLVKEFEAGLTKSTPNAAA